MRRWHEDYYGTLRRLREYRRSHAESDQWAGGQQVFACPRLKQPGRFRKKDAYDCGRTGCLICHGDKFPVREKHEQELVADFAFREQMREFEGR